MSWGDTIPNPFEEMKDKELQSLRERVRQLEDILRRVEVWLIMAEAVSVGGAGKVRRAVQDVLAPTESEP